MLIGQFGETYPPTLDGVGRVMASYCQTLQAMGHRSLYIAPENPAFAETPGLEAMLYPSVKVPTVAYHVGFPRLHRAFMRQLMSLPFDVVHAHTPFMAGRATRSIARKRHIPLVATFHSKYYDDFLRVTHSKVLSNLAMRYVLAFYKTCDEVWAVNSRTAQVLRDYGYQDTIRVMPNGTDQEFLSAQSADALIRPFHLRDGIPTLLFVGQQDFKKNTQSILKACALLAAKMDFQLLMVGGGADRPRLEALTQELGLGRKVSFLGFIHDRQTLLSVYDRADLLVFPSLYDNAPMVVREAAIMGTPSLLIEGSCAAEGIEHKVNGYLCRNTPEDIAAGIMDALPTAIEVGVKAQQTIPVPWQTLMRDVLARYAAIKPHL